MLGDAFAENKLIAAQLKQLRKDSLFLDDGVTSSSTQIKSLIDNAVAELSRLNLTAFDVATRGLSSSQANSLTNDIITFEATNINGMSIIVPKIYLSLSTRNKLLGTSDSVTSDSASASLATGSTIYSGGDLTINSPSASLTNNGSIISNGNLTLNLASLTSTFSISTLPTIAAPTIKSVAGSINIATTNNITLKNTLLNSGNKITLSAKDINISNDPISLAASTLRATSAKSGELLFSSSSIKDDAESARSAITFNALSDIELNSTGSINIDNNYLNTGGSIFMTASNDINNSNYTIKAENNVVMNAANINNIHADSNYSATTGATTNETRIEAGSIVSLNATNDITNIGATIKAGDLLYLTAGNNINNEALVNYKINGNSATETEAIASNANNIKSTLVSQGTLEAGGNLVLVAGNDINNKGSNITSTGSSYLEATAGDINIETAALRDRTVTSGGSKKKSWTKVEDATTNLESSITSSGTLDLASLAGDVNITGSKLTSSDNLSLTAKNDINITSAQDSTYSFAAGRTGRGKSYLNKSSSTTQIESELSTTNNGDISITSGIGNTDTIGADGSKGSIAIIASKLKTQDSDADDSNNTGTGDITLTAKEDLVIVSALNSSYAEKLSSKKGNSTKTTKLNIDSESNNISSDISGNDVSLTSGNSTYIIASNLTGTGSGQLTAGKYVNPSDSSDIAYNVNATVNLVSATDEKFHYAMTQKISTDFTAVAVGVVAAVAVAAATGPVGMAMAGASGGMIGAGAKKSKTTTELAYDAVQKSTVLTFNDSLSVSSGSDTNIVSSNLNADSITINAGKIADDSGDLQTINESANLNISTIADIHKRETSVKETHANYLAVALTSAAVTAMSIAVGAAGQAGGNAIGTAAAGAATGQALGNAMFYAGMAGTSLSMVNGASAASTESSSSSLSQTTQTRAASNLNTTNNLNLLATKNLNISASNLQTSSSSGNINLNSETGDVNLLAGINSTSTATSSQHRNFSGVGFSHTNSSVGMDFTQMGDSNADNVTQNSAASANLVSANNININSGSLLTSSDSSGSTSILASNLSADNQININSNNELNIKSTEEVTNILSSHSDITNTITLSVGNAWLGLADSTVQSARAVQQSSGSQTDDKAKAANTTAASAQLGMNALQAIITAPSYGFYGSVTETLSRTTTDSNTNYVTNAASNLYATNDITLVSNSDLTVKGSNITSESGDINLRSKEGNVNIIAAANSATSGSSSETDSYSVTVGVSGGGVFMTPATYANSRNSSDLSSTSYLSSNLTALNGSVNINAKDDTNVIGSSLLAKDIALTTTNLNVESLQSKLSSHSESNSYSVGGNVSFGNSSSNQDRLWTDNVASIIGANSVTINTENNTNLIGSVIANSTNGLIGSGAIDGGNLALNTKTLAYSNLNDHNKSDSSALGFGIGFSTNTNIPASAINLNYAANSGDQKGETKATIGGGTINLNSIITRDASTGEVTSITGSETLANNDSRISTLNREIQTNQIDNGTHYEGGYNINLSILPNVLQRANQLRSDGLLADEARKNLGGTVKLLYNLTPMGTNTVIETTRGIKQSLAWGEDAVYKSGTEENGIRSEGANNVGQQFVPINPKDGSVDLSRVGDPISFGTGLPGLLAWAGSSKEGGLVSQTCNYGVPGCNDMSLTHDPLAGHLKRTYPNIPEIITNQGTIIPAYIYNTYGLIGKPVNVAIDYFTKPATTTNLTPILNSIPVPALQQNLQQK